MARKRKRKPQPPSPNELFLFSPEEMSDMIDLPDTVPPPAEVKAKPAVRQEKPVVQEKEAANRPEKPVFPDEEAAVQDEEPVVPRRMESGDDMVDIMVSAMNLLDQLYSPSQVRLVAMECATRAQSGISNDKIYELPALPGHQFTGRQFTALYYVSFARSFSSMIDRINLPLADEYAAALERYDSII